MKLGFEGYTSGEVYVLNRVAELARRFGLRPSDADAEFDLVRHPDFEYSIYQLSFGHRPDAPGTEKGDKFDKMMDALGCRDSGGVQAEHLSSLEDIVERAMSLAPRPRTIG